MAILFVQRTGSVGSSSSATTLVLTISGITTTVGNHLILGAIGAASVISSVADSKGNAWQVDGTKSVGNARPSLASTRIAAALVGSDTVTVTWVATTDGAFYIDEFSGLATFGWFDVAASATGTAGLAADSTATATSAGTDSLIVGAIGHINTVVAFAMEVLSPVWTLGASIASTGLVRRLDATAYRVVSDGPRTYSAKATWTTNARDWGAIVGVYKAAGAAGPAVRPLMVPLRVKGSRQPPWAGVPIRVGSAPESPIFIPLTQVAPDAATFALDANDASIAVAPVPAAAAITFAAQTPTASVGAVASNAGVTFAAQSPTVKVGQAAFPAAAAITFAAPAPIAKVAQAAGSATVDFRAIAPTVSNLTVIHLATGGLDSANEYIGFLRLGSMVIKATTDRRDSTMDFVLTGAPSDFLATAGFDMYPEINVGFTAGSQVMFSGRIASIKPRDLLVPGKMEIAVSCADWTSLATDTIIDPAVASGARTTVESDAARIAWLISTFFVQWESDKPASIDSATYVATLLASMPAQDYTGLTLAAALDLVCSITGGNWFIDFGTIIPSIGSGFVPNPALHYFGTRTLTTPFGAAATDTLTSSAHGMTANQPVTFVTKTGGTGLSIGPTYYVIASGLTANAFKLSATLGGAAVDFTTDISAGQFNLVIQAPFGLSDAPDNVTTYEYEVLNVATETTQFRKRVVVIGGNGYTGVFGLTKGRAGVIKDSKITDATTAALAAQAYLLANATQISGTVRTRRSGLSPGMDVVITSAGQLRGQGDYGTGSQTFRITTLTTNYERNTAGVGVIVYAATFGTVPQLLHTAIRDIAAVQATQIANAAIAGVLAGYIGEIVGWPLATPPVGFLIANGQSLLRAGTYAGLFAVLGTTFGFADGTHFNVPNLTDRMILGVGAKALAATGGALGHTHTEAAHTHTGPSHSHSHSHAGPSHTHTGPSHTHSQNIMPHRHETPLTASGTTSNLTWGDSMWGTGSTQTRTGTLTGAANTASAATMLTSDIVNAAGATTAADGTGATGASGTGATDTDATAGGTGATGSTAGSGTGAADPPYLALYYIIRYA